MFSPKTILILATTILGFSNALTSFGGCPSYSVQSSFVPSSYMGYWYEVGRDNAIIFEGGGCIRAKYSNLVGTKFEVKNGLYWYGADSYSWLGGTATCPDGLAKCKVTFESPFFQFMDSLSTSTTTNYNILATDYTGYAIVYSCSNVLNIPNFMKSESVWVLSRT